MSLTDTAPRTGTTPPNGAPLAATPPAGLPPALGGTRGLIDGGLPPLVFVAVNAVAGAQTTRPIALTRRSVRRPPPAWASWRCG
jgi:hypothetical protein